jgi:hypothetical protein
MRLPRPEQLPLWCRMMLAFAAVSAMAFLPALILRSIHP